MQVLIGFSFTEGAMIGAHIEIKVAGRSMPYTLAFESNAKMNIAYEEIKKSCKSVWIHIDWRQMT